MNIYPKFLVFFYLFLIYTSFEGYSQHAKREIDSMLNLLKKPISDTLQVRICYKLALKYIYNSPDTCQLYGEKILKIAEKNENVWAKGVAYLIIGDAHFSRSELTTTLQYYLDAVNILERVQPVPKELATLYAQIISLYVELQQYNAGEEYAQKCIALQKKFNNLAGLASAYNNTGDLYEKQKKLDDAAQNYAEALVLGTKLNMPYSIAIANFNLGSVSRQQGKIQAAFQYIDKAMLQSKALADWEGVIYNDLEYGRLYFAEKKYPIALQYADSALSLSIKYENKKLQRDAYQLKSDIFEEKKDIDSAYFYVKQAKIVNDSIYNEFHQKLIFSLTTNQKIHSLEQQALLNQQALNKQIQTTNILIIIGLILSGALLTLFLLHYQKRKHNALLQSKNEQIELQKTELETLNGTKDKILSVISHDLRAPINQIKSLLHLLHQDVISPAEFLAITEKFYSQVDCLSDNLENLLHWAYSQMRGANVQKQALKVANYVQQIAYLYEAALSQKNINLTWNVPQDLEIYADKEHLKVALRNIVGNAIKFSHKDGAIFISAGEKAGHTFITIADKGMGMTKMQLQHLFSDQETMSSLGTFNEGGAGVGLKLSKDFIEKCGGRLEVQSEAGEGTSFTIFMPKMA